MREVILDTNTLLNGIDLTQFDKVYVPIVILEELDSIKHKSEGERNYKARHAIKQLESATNVEYKLDYSYSLPQFLSDGVPDNRILGYAKDICTMNKNAVLLSGDINMLVKAKALGIPYEKYEGFEICEDKYFGFKIVEMSNIELANFYENEVKANLWDLKVNEYLLIQDNITGKVIDYWVWTKSGFRHISAKKIDSVALGKIKLLDEYQMCVVDSLSNNAVTMIKGTAGTGKSLLTASYAMAMLEKNKIDKIIVFTNPVATRNSAKLGFYPGNKDEKLLDSQIGNMLASKFGSKLTLTQLINQEKLVLLPFSDIRGFDTSNMNALIWITEAQNLDVELMRLAIQRVGDDCQIVIDGDYSCQVDCKEFDGMNNGMRRLSEVFRNNEFYGEIELQNTYRSKWAELANLL